MSDDLVDILQDLATEISLNQYFYTESRGIRLLRVSCIKMEKNEVRCYEHK